MIGPRGRDCNSWSAISSVLSAIVEIFDYRNYHHLLKLSSIDIIFTVCCSSFRVVFCILFYLSHTDLNDAHCYSELCKDFFDDNGFSKVSDSISKVNTYTTKYLLVFGVCESITILELKHCALTLI